MDIWEEIRAEDEKRLAEARLEMASEKAAWDALAPEQKAERTVAMEAKFADSDELPEDDEPCTGCGELDCDFDCDGDYDDEEAEEPK